MNAWLKIEALLNKFLNLIKDKIADGVSKITPNKVKKTIESTKGNIKNTEDKIMQSSKQFVGKAKEKSLGTVQKVKEYDIKTKVQEQKEKRVAQAKALTFAKVGAFLGAMISAVFFAAKKYLSSLSPNFIVGSVVASSLSLLTGVTIYKNAKEIVEKSSGREPAAIVTEMPSGRPEWYKGDLKHIQISNLKLPIYISGSNSVKTLLMDFTFESSNRYIKVWTEENEHEIRDHILSTVEPILPSFPLSEEGKIIVKEKIKLEVNKYLKKKGIEGKIKLVNINRIIAG